MKSAKPYNPRVIIAACLAAALLGVGVIVGLMANSSSDNSNGRPGPTGTTAEPSHYVAMVVDGDMHAMLDFKVHPEGGQIDGTYTLVDFTDTGRETRDEQPFTGKGTDTTFQFEGLTDSGVPVPGSVTGNHLVIGLTFGPLQETKWDLIQSKDVFDGVVGKYAKRFKECSKEQDYSPCED